MKRTPNKRKLDGSSSDQEAPQVLVWNITDAPPKHMAHETISAMQAFSSANIVTMGELIIEI